MGGQCPVRGIIAARCRVETRSITRQWRYIYGYSVSNGALTVNFPALVAGGPTCAMKLRWKALKDYE